MGDEKVIKNALKEIMHQGINNTQRNMVAWVIRAKLIAFNTDNSGGSLCKTIFAVSRITGWTAHLLEQWSENRLIRPRAAYVGKRDLKVVPIDER